MGQLERDIVYPYLHPEGRIDHVPLDDPFMQLARNLAMLHTLDTHMPNASVITAGQEILGWAANGSTYHQEQGCERVRLQLPTGEGYGLCEGCHPKNHSENKAVEAALAAGHDPAGAEVTLFGHWWCCESCWLRMISHGIRVMRLLEHSEVLFNREEPGNIIGRQFEATAVGR